MTADPMLIVRAAGLMIALPLAAVLEITPLLPTTPVAGMPDRVRGFAILRGQATPVLALSSSAGVASRRVIMRDGALAVAVEVDEVLGIEAIDPMALRPLTGVWRHAAAAMGRREDEPLAVLDVARVVPPELAEAMTRVRQAGSAIDHGDG